MNPISSPNRRLLLFGAGSLLVTGLVAAPALRIAAQNLQGRAGLVPAGGRPEVFYFDDLTQIIGTLSPYHKARQPLTDDMLKAAVDEAAATGADVYIVQPGSGWVPWWKSSLYPAAEHYKWFQETYGVPLSPLAKYMLAGGDMLQVALDQCRARGMPCIATLRLNDHHGIFFSGRGRDEVLQARESKTLTEWYRAEAESLEFISKVHADHPEWRLVPHDPKKPEDVIWNWAVPEAVKFKLALFSEVCRYEVDGIELDFLRFPRFFREETPGSQRLSIMENFVRGIRKALDSGPAAGKGGRILSVRVPADVKLHENLGIDLRRFAAAGATHVNASHGYCTDQDDADLDALRAAAGSMNLHLELAQASSSPGGGYEGNVGLTDRFILSAPSDLLTAAAIAEAHRFQGVSLFNFQYYRLHAKPTNVWREQDEPPFWVVKAIQKRDWLAGGSRSFFLGSGIYSLSPTILPGRLESGASLRLTLPGLPQVGPVRGGRLYVAHQAWDKSDGIGEDVGMTASLNGHRLARAADRALWPGARSLPLNWSSWDVPADQVRNGSNGVELAIAGGVPEQRVIFVKLDLPAGAA